MEKDSWRKLIDDLRCGGGAPLSPIAKMIGAVPYTIIIVVVWLAFIMIWPWPNLISIASVSIIACTALAGLWRLAMQKEPYTYRVDNPLPPESCTAERLPDLLLLLDVRDEFAKSAAARAVIRSILVATDLDLRRLSGGQRRILARHLLGSNCDLTLAILRAIARMEDAEFIPALERLSRSNARFAIELEVQRQAIRTINAVRESAANRRLELLRPSGVQSERCSELLRAPSYCDATSRDELVRPPSSTGDRSDALQ